MGVWVKRRKAESANKTEPTVERRVFAGFGKGQEIKKSSKILRFRSLVRKKGLEPSRD